MRAIWKGYLRCSLVTIPIKRFTATTRPSRQFHFFHKDCGSRIDILKLADQAPINSICYSNGHFLAPDGVRSCYRDVSG